MDKLGSLFGNLRQKGSGDAGSISGYLSDISEIGLGKQRKTNVIKPPHTAVGEQCSGGTSYYKAVGKQIL